jgi:hypothetical protein
VTPTNYVEGIITSFSGTTLIMTSDAFGGSGTYTSWNVETAGNVGATGPTGATGPAGTGANISVSDEGSLLTSGVTSFNFTGSGVTASAATNAVTVNIPGGGSGVTVTGTPASGQLTSWTGATSIQGITSLNIDSNGNLKIGAGNFQSGNYVLYTSTTNATPSVLTTNGSAAGAANQVVLPNNSSFTFSILVIARQQASGGTSVGSWKIEGVIRREGTAASTTLTNSALTTFSNSPAWNIAVSADTTNGALSITATGAASTNIRWSADVLTSEVIYA